MRLVSATLVPVSFSLIGRTGVAHRYILITRTSASDGRRLLLLGVGITGLPLLGWLMSDLHDLRLGRGLEVLLDFSQALVEAVLSMASDVAVNPGLCRISRLQPLGGLIAKTLIFDFRGLAPPGRVDLVVYRGGSSPLVSTSYGVRVVHLVTHTAVGALGAATRVALAPGAWSLRHKDALFRLFGSRAAPAMASASFLRGLLIIAYRGVDLTLKSLWAGLLHNLHLLVGRRLNNREGLLGLRLRIRHAFLRRVLFSAGVTAIMPATASALAATLCLLVCDHRDLLQLRNRQSSRVLATPLCNLAQAVDPHKHDCFGDLVPVLLAKQLQKVADLARPKHCFF